jgi:hypothetical protein
MFDRVYLINLKRRPDRLDNFRRLQKHCGWHLPEPMVYEAVDGSVVGVPNQFRCGPGAFGCLLTHRRILEDCLMSGTDSALIMEDDITWVTEGWNILKQFMADVPADWQQVMLGGQHTLPPSKVTDTVYKITNCQRTHAYSVRGDTKKSLLEAWYTCNVHCDWKMGEWQKDIVAYAPHLFPFGQMGGKSDIAGRDHGPRYWDWSNEVNGEYLLIARCPKFIMDNLKGFHRGYWLNANGQDEGLIQISTLEDKTAKLKEWVKVVSSEAESIGSVPVIWHPGITVEDVRAITSRNIVVVEASTIEEFERKWREASSKDGKATSMVRQLERHKIKPCNCK